MFFFIALGFPFLGGETKFLSASYVQTFRTTGLESLYQLADRAGLLLVVAVVAVEHPDEGPLRPFVIFGITGTDLTAPIVAETDLFQLLPITGYIILCRDLRMLSGLDGVLLRGQSVSVVTHRVQYVKTLQTFETRINIRSYITERVANVQSRTGRIGEHVQYIVFRLIRVLFDFINLFGNPVVVPLLLNLSEIVLHDRLSFLYRFLFKATKLVNLFILYELFT